MVNSSCNTSSFINSYGYSEHLLLHSSILWWIRKLSLHTGKFFNSPPLSLSFFPLILPSLLYSPFLFSFLLCSSFLFNFSFFVSLSLFSSLFCSSLHLFYLLCPSLPFPLFSSLCFFSSLLFSFPLFSVLLFPSLLFSSLLRSSLLCSSISIPLPISIPLLFLSSTSLSYSRTLSSPLFPRHAA